MTNTLSHLVSRKIGEGRDRLWRGPVVGVSKNGSIYGIPTLESRVVKFNPVDKSIIRIGPDLRIRRLTWLRGDMTHNGMIYCVPKFSDRGILKIDTRTDTVTELDVNLLPERIDIHMMWISCALSPLDGCIYFMPYHARRIMKLDPTNDDAVSSVGDELERGELGGNYIGTVVGIDGCIYGMPRRSKCIVKYDPINDITSFVEKKADKWFGRRALRSGYLGVFGCCALRSEYFGICEDGALGRDGCIYALKEIVQVICEDGDLGSDGCIYALKKIVQVLKIDTINNSYCSVGNRVETDDDDDHSSGIGWGEAILGIDGCIYWPPYKARRILMYDPHSNLTSLVGEDFGNNEYKWKGGYLAADGIIYCFPYHTYMILAIDPLKEYTMSLKKNMEEHTDQLGCIFQPSDDIPHKTNFDRAVTKFGKTKVLELLEDYMPPVDHVCTVSNLYPFMIAASYESSDISVIYHLLCHMPSLTNQSIMSVSFRAR